MNGWQNILGATDPLLSYTPVKTGDRIRCRLTSDATCVADSIVFSAPLTFVVHTPTSIPQVTPMSASIRMYPNPAITNLVVDSLRLTDNWEYLEISAIIGEKSIIRYSIRTKQSVSVSVANIAKGMYILVLRRRDGTAVYRKFIKV